MLSSPEIAIHKKYHYERTGSYALCKAHSKGLF
ncbi:hypothetical protein RCH13_002606, partial [Chryseobacterium sp. MP_3.2]|nr:hypothetical protein [Chryseobacterium sp. MP_3.2]